MANDSRCLKCSAPLRLRPDARSGGVQERRIGDRVEARDEVGQHVRLRQTQPGRKTPRGFPVYRLSAPGVMALLAIDDFGAAGSLLGHPRQARRLSYRMNAAQFCQTLPVLACTSGKAGSGALGTGSYQNVAHDQSSRRS